MILPAVTSALPIYIPAALILGLLGFITIIAWVTRATAVAVLAAGLCIVATGLLVLWTSYINRVEGPFEYVDQVFLRLVAATFVGFLIIQSLIAKRCWQEDRARRRARTPVAVSRQASAEDFDEKWILSLLQKKVAESREKVSTSEAVPPSTTVASTAEKRISP